MWDCQSNLETTYQICLLTFQILDSSPTIVQVNIYHILCSFNVFSILLITGCHSLVIVLSLSIRKVVSSSPARAGRVKPKTFKIGSDCSFAKSTPFSLWTFTVTDESQLSSILPVVPGEMRAKVPVRVREMMEAVKEKQRVLQLQYSASTTTCSWTQHKISRWKNLETRNIVIHCQEYRGSSVLEKQTTFNPTRRSIYARCFRFQYFQFVRTHDVTLYSCYYSPV
jgi:hypothetical protein